MLVSHQVGEAMVPVVVGATIDRAIVTGDAGALAQWLGVLVVTFAVLSFSYRFGDRFLERASETAAHDLRLALTRRILHPRGGAGEDRLSGGLLSIATSDAAHVGEIACWIGVRGGGGRRDRRRVGRAAARSRSCSAPLVARSACRRCSS